MIFRMVKNTVFWINAISISSGMSCTIHPQTIVTGTTIDLNKYCRIEFGAYTKAHKKNLPTKLHTIPQITCYIPWTNRKPPRFLLVTQPPHKTPYQKMYLCPSPCTDAYYRPHAHAC